MAKKRLARMTVLACAGVASLGLLAAPPAAAKTKKKVVTKTAAFNQCVSVASPIDDPTAPFASAVIPVSVPNFKGGAQDGTVNTITSVGTRITHTNDADLVISLVSPGGKVIALSAARGGFGGGFGTGSASCSGSLVQFGDAFGTPVPTTGTTDDPITGSFKPDQPLNQVLGGPARGSWVLLVADEVNLDTGSLNAFSLNITYTYKALAKKKGKK